MSMRISTRQLQKTILAPTMQQSIEVLLLPLTELHSAIDQELQENPMLEVDEEAALTNSQLDSIINNHFTSYGKNARETFYENTSDDDPLEERPISRVISFQDYLLKQLHWESQDETTLRVGEHIIGNLDENGYLTTSCEEIAAQIKVSVKTVEDVLLVIQDFEPLGVASRSLQECLLLQIRQRYQGEALVQIGTIIKSRCLY